MKTTQAICAKEIRKEIKQAFPKTKFSVKSDSGSMTSSVDVFWTDGPTEEMVNDIIKKYSYEHNYDKTLPQARFIFANRRMSEETESRIIKEHNEKFCEEGQIKAMHDWNESAKCWNNQVVYRIFNKLVVN